MNHSRTNPRLIRDCSLTSSEVLKRSKRIHFQSELKNKSRALTINQNLPARLISCLRAISYKRELSCKIDQ